MIMLVIGFGLWVGVEGGLVVLGSGGEGGRVSGRVGGGGEEMGVGGCRVFHAG